ncbi:DUF1343 domain-containing protein [Pelagicoccus sp. SDUM812003]|uniref:DUF1343 domain-containing protein n=1 Tax=Pelagicoccus sp. SDUM812003 TaxID=3041267 RepID=UPI00280E389D|nr:DUF1343 domain-containing protein [Pelagicoccus sp. SDUM812003]MDQ8201697.1 DUF1343 domain-containing protein [Pelagicoccus sp. SDUM812003]
MWRFPHHTPSALRRLIHLALAFAGILAAAPTHGQYIQRSNTTTPILLGIDVLESENFQLIRGKRVGLLTHPAGVNRHGVSTIQVLRSARGVQLVALFGPEHGIYGDEKADVPVLDKVDQRTGLPVYSLYGKYRKPTPEMLQTIDTLIIDLQDVGTRSYTFVSCMKLAIEACFENGKEVVVLDRPNPLGGLKVDGPPLETKWMSYVGSFQVPYVHGLTIGELARMAVSKPGVLDVSEQQRLQGVLHVVQMDGWKRYMSWPQTGLRWVPTSPFIPDFEAAVGYPMTGLGAQIGGFKHGIGSEYPFRCLRYGDMDIDKLKAELEAKNIPGIDFVKRKTNQGTGLYIKVTDWNSWRPTELSFHMMQLTAKFENGNPFATAPESTANLFNKHVGSSSWWDHLATKGEWANVEGYVMLWQRQAKQFQIDSRRYWFYD